MRYATPICALGLASVRWRWARAERDPAPLARTAVASYLKKRRSRSAPAGTLGRSNRHEPSRQLHPAPGGPARVSGVRGRADRRGLPGPVLELGLGNGRTYDHLRALLPEREIFVFEREVNAHPDCVPDAAHLILGDLRDTLAQADRRLPGPAALVHSDVGTGDAALNAELAAWLAGVLPPLLARGAWVVSDQMMQRAGAGGAGNTCGYRAEPLLSLQSCGELGASKSARRRGANGKPLSSGAKSCSVGDYDNGAKLLGPVLGGPRDRAVPRSRDIALRRQHRLRRDHVRRGAADL